MSRRELKVVRFWDPALEFDRLEADIVPAMLATLRAGDLVMRKEMYQFERDFASMIGREHGVGVSNCTDGLRLTLQALGIGAGAEVITVGHTFVATIAAIHHVGAVPVLVDVAGDHLMDVNSLKAAVTSRTRAVVPVHLNGRTCDMPAIMQVADEYGLLVVEDSAQAINARIDGKTAGTFGVAAAYSFYPAKLLGAFGDAGIVITDDKRLADGLRLLRDHGRATKQDLDGWGWNCRMDNLQASVLKAKLPYVPEWIERRRRLAGQYESGLAGVKGISTPAAPSEGRWYDVFQNYVLEVDSRDALQEHLSREGIETMVSWSRPLHRQIGLGLDHFELPVTEALSRRVLSLPLHQALEESEVDRVIIACRSFRDR